jgi:hypothetical protein
VVMSSLGFCSAQVALGSGGIQLDQFTLCVRLLLSRRFTDSKIRAQGGFTCGSGLQSMGLNEKVGQRWGARARLLDLGGFDQNTDRNPCGTSLA